MPVIRPKPHRALHCHRRKPHRTAGEKPPAYFAVRGVQRRYGIGHHRWHEERVAHHHRFVRRIVPQPHLPRKRRRGRGKLTRPLQMQSARQYLRRGRAAIGAKAELWPIHRTDGQGKSQGKSKKTEFAHVGSIRLPAHSGKRPWCVPRSVVNCCDNHEGSVAQEPQRGLLTGLQ